MDYLVGFFTSGTSWLGLVVVLAVIADVGVTALAVSSGPGPITRVVSRSGWYVFRGLHRRFGMHAPLRAAGPVVVMAVLLTWLVLMIVGWGLVFGQEGSLLQDGEVLTPAFGRIHYAAALVLGRGTSELTPGSWVWRFAEQLAALTGVAFVGVAIAYVLPVINAVVDKRRVAATISALGGNPTEVLTRTFNGRDFGDLDLHLIALTPEIARVAQQHLAYPVVAYFHSSERSTALAPSIAVLDEALTMMATAVDDPEELACGRASTEPLRSALTGFLREVAAMRIHASTETVLPRPDLSPLREAGVPLRPDDEVAAGYRDLADRRALLAAFLVHDASDPDDLHASLGPEQVAEGERGR